MQKDNSAAAGAGPFAEERKGVAAWLNEMAERPTNTTEDHIKLRYAAALILRDAASEPDPRVATWDENDVARAVRAGCNAEDRHLKCTFPDCNCKQYPRGIRAAIEALASPPRDGWMPIDSAPRDTTHIILRWGRTVTEGWWAIPFEGAKSEQCFWRTFAAGDMRPERPTEWQPLPSPPRDGE